MTHMRALTIEYRARSITFRFAVFARMLSHPPFPVFFSDTYLCLDIDIYLYLGTDIEIWGNREIEIRIKTGIYGDIERSSRARIER